MFSKPDHYIGDTWYFVQEDRVHMYYLTCPRSVPRHTRWSIGHAVSADLVKWEDLGVVLEPGAPGTWDGLCLATGSVIEFQGRFYMAYTGNFAGPVPAVGIAVSDDLHTWHKLPENPVCSNDERIYSAAPNLAWDQPRWRDPFLFQEGDEVFQLITAARPDRPEPVAGTVGVAVSSDMVHWHLLPPLDLPDLGQDLECPKLTKIGAQYFLTLSISESIMSEELRSLQPAGFPHATAYTLVANSLQGPYVLHGSGRILETKQWGSPYACEPICFQGQHYLLGTVWDDETHDSVCDPIPITPTPKGFKAKLL